MLGASFLKKELPMISLKEAMRIATQHIGGASQNGELITAVLINKSKADIWWLYSDDDGFNCTESSHSSKDWTKIGNFNSPLSCFKNYESTIIRPLGCPLREALLRK